MWDEDEVARIGHHVRHLVVAAGGFRASARGVGAKPPGRKAAEFLCEAILLEMDALADDDGPRAGRQDTAPNEEQDRAARLGRLLLLGKSMVVACEQGAFDDPSAGFARLAHFAAQLGDGYATLLRTITPLPPATTVSRGTPSARPARA
jgi:hypothetical protein